MTRKLKSNDKVEKPNNVERKLTFVFSIGETVAKQRSPNSQLLGSASKVSAIKTIVRNSLRNFVLTLPVKSNPRINPTTK